MNAHQLLVILAIAVLLGLWLAGMTAMVNHKLRKATRGSASLSEGEYASRLHALARALIASPSSDQRAAGAILLNHAHLLRPTAKYCGCPTEQIIGGRRAETPQRTTNEPDRPHTEIR